MTGETLLQAKDLDSGYDGQVRLSDVNFSVSAGQRVALLGPNGGGKTTLIKTLAGELSAIEGSFVAAGAIGTVPQHDPAREDWPATALDAVICGTLETLPWWRVPGKSQRATAREALGAVGLSDRTTIPYGELSGGQRRRVQVAAALAGGARILLLDEPFAGLDAVAARRLEDLLERLAGEGSAILIATHDLEQARKWERVLCLNKAQIAYGPAETVLDRPTLERTFGSDLIEVPGGGLMAPPHHHHDH